MTAAAAPRQQLQAPDYKLLKNGFTVWLLLQQIPDQPGQPMQGAFGPVEQEDVVGAGQSLQQDLLLRDGLGRVELHPDELPHVLVHQADAGAVDNVSDVGRNPVNSSRNRRRKQSAADRRHEATGPGRTHHVTTPTRPWLQMTDEASCRGQTPGKSCVCV